MKDVEEFHPKNQKEWRNWLEENHVEQDAIWVIFYRKKSPDYNMGWSESVDEALCFGWIDSTKKTIDNEKFKQYFSKRKAKSNWSRVNKDKVKTLIDQGLMQKEGYKSIEIAKENGSWTFLDNVEDLIIPDDLIEEFSNFEGAKEFYDGLSNSVKKMLLYWVISAKRKETRQKRVLEIAENAGNNMKPKQFR
ncbi:YdeI/OmpD-associated family protein [Brumimicrobium mesophilum]|uniref:YdeI/OmpD-associated family protein n=1 Tax=Brumimicrobium mesophilum TaxID=392717 RepID=UPI000D13F360|nr:YdeI/OmpD-associated family protein [Brumimicrobium mesophilum]